MKLQGVVLAMVVLGVFNMGAVDAADAIFVFGDSFMDTGNLPMLNAPYGTTWPGYPDNRWSDGRNQADYFDGETKLYKYLQIGLERGRPNLQNFLQHYNTAELFELPTPTPFLHLQNDSSQARKGVNFARSGAGVTYAYGVTPLDTQVDNMQALVANGILAQPLLRKSVAVLNIGVNDYDSRNLQAPFRESAFDTKELATFVSTVVDGIAVTIVRLHAMGVRHMVVTNLPLMACTPFAIQDLAFTACTPNSTILNQTSLHNALLQERVKALNNLRGLHVVIADQTKAFQELFAHGAQYGFVDPLIPCCHGNGTNLYNLVCGSTDSEGRAMYTECKDPSKAVLFDTIHPTDAAWKAVIHLYASVAGFTLEGPMLHTWIRKYNV